MICSLAVACCVGSCVSSFTLDLPDDHPASATAPVGGSFEVPDPARISAEIEAVPAAADDMHEGGGEHGRRGGMRR